MHGAKEAGRENSENSDSSRGGEIPVTCPVQISGVEYALADLVQVVRQQAMKRQAEQTLRKKMRTGHFVRQGGSRCSKEYADEPVDLRGTLVQMIRRTAAVENGQLPNCRSAAAEQGGLVNHRPSGSEQALRARPEDFRWQRTEPLLRADILFLLDISRSSGFQKRLSFTKSAVLELLSQAYQNRDRVGLITFGNSRAELVLPFTRSVSYAAGALSSLRASGNTPLGMGIRRGMEQIFSESRRRSGTVPVMIVLTDGKVNYDDLPGDPWEQACAAGRQTAEAGIPVILVDTDSGIFSLGLAEQLAEQMRAVYTRLG